MAGIGRSGLTGSGVVRIGWVMVVLCVVVLAGCSGEVDWTSILEDVLADSLGGDCDVSDLAGTWTGTLTSNSQSESYQFIVDSAGSFTSDAGFSGSVTCSSGGTVVFTYSLDNYTIAVQGSLDDDKTAITMSMYAWSGTSSGSATLSGTLSLADSDTFKLADLVGTWTGTLTENDESQSYQFVVDSDGSFTAGDSISGTASITSGGTVKFVYTSENYSGTLKGTMNDDKTQIVMASDTWTGAGSGTAEVSGTLYNTDSGGFLSAE